MDSWLFPPVRAILERANGLPQILGETEVPERPLFSPVHALSGTNLVSRDIGLENSATKAGIAFNTAGNCAVFDQGMPQGSSNQNIDCMWPSFAWLLCSCTEVHMHLAGVAREHTKHDRQMYWSAAQLSSAYTSGAVTPTQVAENILQHVAHSQQSEPAMNYFVAIDTQAVRTQAAQSTIRS